MVKRWTFVLVFFACLSPSVWGADVTPGTRETALAVLKVMGTDTLEAVIRSMLDARIRSNPGLAPHRDALLSFQLHVLWDVAAPELADLYARTFTEPELHEILAFYQSPAGEKLIARTPALFEEESKILERILAEHKPQLEEILRAPAKEAAPPAQGPEGERGAAPPGAEETLLDRADRLFDTKKWKEARDAYAEHLKSEPNDVNARTDLGVCYRELADFDGALREFDRSLALDPGHWQALYNKIVVLSFDLKKSSEAQVLLSKLRALQPHNSDVEKLAAALAKR